MDSLVLIFVLLFCIIFLAPMLWLLITTGQQISKTKDAIRNNEEEIKKILKRL